MDLSQVHKFRGSFVSYVLPLEGDSENPYYVYVGSTANIEQRMADHAMGRGAKWTRLHKPTGQIWHLQLHDTMLAAMCAEVALWNLWAGKVGYQRVRGGRYNMTTPMWPPPGFRNIDSERNADSNCEASSGGSPVSREAVSVPVSYTHLTLPTKA